MQIEIRYFAGAAAAAGRETDTVDVDATATLQDLCRVLAQRHRGLDTVLGACSLLVDEVPAPDRTRGLAGAQQVDVLPPFAGG